jgi:hypothetical protein
MSRRDAGSLNAKRSLSGRRKRPRSKDRNLDGAEPSRVRAPERLSGEVVLKDPAAPSI